MSFLSNFNKPAPKQESANENRFQVLAQFQNKFDYKSNIPNIVFVSLKFIAPHNTEAYAVINYLDESTRTTKQAYYTLTQTGLIPTQAQKTEPSEINRAAIFAELNENLDLFREAPIIRLDLLLEPTSSIDLPNPDKKNQEGTDEFSDLQGLPDSLVDIERTRFLFHLPGNIVRIIPESRGMEYYRGVLRNGYIVLDAPVKDHAIYIIDVDLPVEVEELRKMTTADLKSVLELIRDQHLGNRARKTLRDDGAQTVYHQGKDWKQQLMAEILKRDAQLKKQAA